jgi:hypothetical protein
MQTSPPAKTFDPWQATQALTGMATRVMGSEEYLGRTIPEVGTRVGDHAFEIFSICPPAEALQLQFEAQQPTFIAIHDLGTAMCARFLAELAAALHLPLQTLTIRRSGVGVTLATLQFIELPSAKGAHASAPLRVYATAADADTSTRRLLAEALLAFSRLGVVLVGAMAPHAVAAQFAPLRERVLTVPWNNQKLLLVPVTTPSPELAEQTRRLVAGTTVSASVTPVAADTPGRWGYIHAAWSRLRSNLPETRLSFDTPAPAPAQAPPPEALPMRPMPATSAAAGRLGNAQLARYAQSCSMLKGSLGCCLFELQSGRTVAHAGRRGNIETLAAQGTNLLAAALDSGARLGDTGGSAECMITLDRQLLFVRQMPQQSSLGMLAVFDRALANPMLVRVQLQRLEPLLDAA